MNKGLWHELTLRSLRKDYMSDTPRTDAIAQKYYMRGQDRRSTKQWKNDLVDCQMETVELARLLERELAEQTWELAQRAGLDKAREEDRLRERTRAEAAEATIARLGKDALRLSREPTEEMILAAWLLQTPGSIDAPAPAFASAMRKAWITMFDVAAARTPPRSSGEQIS